MDILFFFVIPILILPNHLGGGQDFWSIVFLSLLNPKRLSLKIKINSNFHNIENTVFLNLCQAMQDSFQINGGKSWMKNY